MRSARVAAAVALASALIPGVAPAAELSGSARVYGGPTKSTVGNDTLDQDLLYQLYNVMLTQSLTPWLSLTLGYRHNRFDNESDVLDFWRKSDEPNIQLAYNRPHFTALLLYTDRALRSSVEAQDLDVSTALASFGYTPDKGPIYALSWRRQLNVADVATYGRNVESRTIDADIRYDRALWAAAYHFQSYSLDTRDTGVQLDQIRHELRGNVRNDAWGGRLSWYADGLLIESRQKERVPSGQSLGQVLRARIGLFAVDALPDLSTLDPAPDLTDNDFATPARSGVAPGDPIIEIGGANTFRNLGLDLGVNRQLTRLEIDVDSVSGPAVVWTVWESPDNLSWTEVPGVVSTFDTILLRYTLSFPQVENRYVKAVNVTANSQPNVAVTEVRAFLDVTSLTSQNTTSMRLNAGATVQPTERVTGRFRLSYNDDENLAGGLTGRNYREYTYDFLFKVALDHNLTANAGYRLTDYEERAAPVLYRTEEYYQAYLDWDPLATVSGRFLMSRRDEKQRGSLIRQVDSVQARLQTQVYENLQMISEVIYNNVDDPFSGFQQQTWRVQETASARVSRTLRLDGSVILAWFDFSAVVDLKQRNTARLLAAWTPFPYLNLTGSWGITREQREFSPEREYLDQRYTVVWTPGPKLSATLVYQDFDAHPANRTTASTASLNYRLNRRFTLFVSGTRSTTENVGALNTDVKSLTAGFYLTF